MSRKTVETWIIWRGGMWRSGDVGSYLADGAEIVHGVVRPGPEGDEMDALAKLSVQPDNSLQFTVAGAVVRTMPAGSDPAEVRVVWEALIASVGGNIAHTTG